MRIDIIIATCKILKEIQPQINEIKLMTPESHRIIATCQSLSAAINRNWGLSWANSDIIVMMDDDIMGFYKGWLPELINSMFKNTIIMSARFLNKKGAVMHMMGGERNMNDRIVKAENNRVTTACFAMRKNSVRFDERYIGSGYEDTDFMLQIGQQYPKMDIMINNKCRLVHINEMKKQGGRYFSNNKSLFMAKWNDPAARNQKDWV